MALCPARESELSTDDMLNDNKQRSNVLSLSYSRSLQLIFQPMKNIPFGTVSFCDHSALTVEIAELFIIECSVQQLKPGQLPR